jgi:branched-chain amino acid transport system substrate-binding protein
MVRRLLIPIIPLCLLIFVTIMIVPAFAQEGPIKIGFVGDFIDVSQAYTKDSFNAAQLAVEEFNKGGGLLGRTVELIKRDGGNNPERHYELATELIIKENVAAIFGGASSPCVLKASQACREQKVPYLVSIGNSQAIVAENGHPFVFLFEPNSWMESRGLAVFATLMPWKRFAFVGPDYSWGRDVMKYFKQHFAEIGNPIEWTLEGWHPLGSDDFSSIVRQVIESKPDTLLVASWGEDLRYFIKEAKAQGVFDKMAALGWFSVLPGDTSHFLPEGIWTLSRGPFKYLADKFPQTKQFVDKFHEQFETYPQGFTICTYDSFIAWKQAVLNAGSAKPAIVAEALKGMTFTGMRGLSYIRAIDGQMDCPTYFGRVAYLPEYPSAVLDSVIEVPATKTWLSEAEILSRRK